MSVHMLEVMVSCKSAYLLVLCLCFVYGVCLNNTSAYRSAKEMPSLVKWEGKAGTVGLQRASITSYKMTLDRVRGRY